MAEKTTPKPDPPPPPPRQLSALLRLVVEDGEKVLADKRYQPTSMAYHGVWRENGRRRCFVSDAGVVMAKRLGAPPDTAAHPADCGEWAIPLDAIETAAAGRFVAAAEAVLDRVLSEEEQKRLGKIERPKKRWFRGRAEFRTHLKSLTKTADAVAAAGF